MPDNKLTDTEIKRMMARGCENCIHENKTAYEEPCKFCYSHSEFATKDLVHKIKVEAYKEFAEMLYEELRVYGIKDKFNKAVFLNIVDKSKKELVGDE